MYTIDMGGSKNRSLGNNRYKKCVTFMILTLPPEDSIIYFTRSILTKLENFKEENIGIQFSL